MIEQLARRFIPGRENVQDPAVRRAIAMGIDKESFVQVLLFLVCRMVVRWVFRLLVGLLRHVNGVPLLGGVNRFFGLLLGLATGALDCWLLALLLWFVASVTAGSLEWLTPGVLQQSVGYRFFGAFNPFLTYY